jgi:acetyl esterase/lipase
MKYLTCTLALIALTALAQQPQPKINPSAPRPYQIPPDYADVPYGPHPRNVLDLWKAKADRPTPLVIHIHGGGFTQGDKSTVSPILLRYCLSKGISVATINYRYSTIAPYPAPMRDGARAVQFLRTKAKEWNLDPRAFAATGGSAGAGISLWIGFHDDLADPASPDPILRQSTRLAVVGVTDAQSTYDPRVIAKLIDEKTASISALRLLVGLKPGQQPDEQTYKLWDDSAPINHLKPGAPPVFMFYSHPMRPLPPANAGEGIHNPRMGYLLKDKMDKLGIECQVHLVDEYQGNAPGQTFFPQMVDFFLKYFPK